MAQCPICGAPVAGAENHACENCRQASYTAYTDAQGRQVFASDVPQQQTRQTRPSAPPITRMLIAANVAVFLLMVVNGVSFWWPTGEQIFPWGADYGPAVLTGQYWRMFTAVFVHSGAVHIAMNMWCLWQLGTLAERIFGRSAFLTLYVLSGIAGNVLSIAVNPGVLGVGASGAIFGIAGALIAMLKFGNLRIPKEHIKPILSSLVSFAVYNLIIGASIRVIDNWAHVGGLVCGLLIGFLLSLNTASAESYRRAKTWVFPLVTMGLTAAFIAVRHWRLPEVQHLLSR